MKIDIDKLTEAELIDLNHRIVERLRFLNQMRAHAQMLEFREESVVNRIGWLARRLHTSKKKVIESAIEAYASRIGKEQELDVFQETCGVWRRRESPTHLVKTGRKAFRNSMHRRRG